MQGKAIGSLGEDSTMRTGKGSEPRIKEMATEMRVGEGMEVEINFFDDIKKAAIS
jgi:hypothetical protein